MALRTADKLIAKAAREILKPLGLFQVGSSRTWIDDNGWFLTVVEFQPSSWSKGAYLNVAVSFLWEQGSGFKEVLPYNLGGRELSHEEYDGDDDKFYAKMLKMAQHAKKNILEYRKYSDSLSYASLQMNNFWDANSPSKVITAWGKGMFYYFYGNESAGDEQMKQLVGEYAPNEQDYESGGQVYKRDWVIERAQAAELMLSRSIEEKKEYLLLSIAEKRQRLRNKSSYRKLAYNESFDRGSTTLI